MRWVTRSPHAHRGLMGDLLIRCPHVSARSGSVNGLWFAMLWSSVSACPLIVEHRT